MLVFVGDIEMKRLQDGGSKPVPLDGRWTRLGPGVLVVLDIGAAYFERANGRVARLSALLLEL